MSQRIRRVKAIVIKELHQVIRDPSSLLITVVLPLIILFLYGFGVSLDMNHLRIGVVLEDTAPDARSFLQSLTDSRFFDVTIGRSRKEFDDAITDGRIRGIVVIPSYFSQYRERSETVAPIQVIADGSEPNTASFVQNYVQEAWLNWIKQEGQLGQLKGKPPLVNADPRYWFNAALESRYFLIPGTLALIMTLIGTLLTALVVAREWERGTMEALMATPVSILELIVGKLIPYFFLGMGSMLISTVIGLLVYQVPLRGSILVLILVSSVFLICALSLGLMISTLGKNQFVAAQASITASFLPAFILSGFIFEISTMPVPIRWLTYIVPARYFVSSLKTLFLVGNVWPLLLKNILYMSILAAVILWITSLRTVKRLN